MSNHSNIARDYFGRDADDARNLTQVLGGKWNGYYGTAPCPICQPQRQSHQNALTLRPGLNGKLLLHCKKRNCAFVDVLAAAGMRRGCFSPSDAVILAQRAAEQKVEAAKRAAQAKQVWTEAQPIAGTLVFHA